jgi:hypothetical protein
MLVKLRPVWSILPTSYEQLTKDLGALAVLVFTFLAVRNSTLV